MKSDTTKKLAPFITFEGGEGVGKSTQTKLLCERLNTLGIETLRTREPGGTQKAEAIRGFILEGKPESWGTGSEAVLFAAARLDHVNNLIAPALNAGKWVICDRFADSTRAYQGLTGGTPQNLIDALEILALNGYSPDLTLILDMSPDEAFERVAKRNAEGSLSAIIDRFEKEDLDFHHRLRANFLEIAQENPTRCIVIDADTDSESLSELIWQTVITRFPTLVDERSED